jgi:hypothetical protein
MATNRKISAGLIRYWNSAASAGRRAAADSKDAVKVSYNVAKAVGVGVALVPAMTINSVVGSVSPLAGRIMASSIPGTSDLAKTGIKAIKIYQQASGDIKKRQWASAALRQARLESKLEGASYRKQERLYKQIAKTRNKQLDLESKIRNLSR